MRAHLAQLAIAGLLSSALGLEAADSEASVKLTGIAHFNNRGHALLEIQSRPGRPVIKPILAEGESVEGVEVKEINAQSGRVRVVHNGVETFFLVGTGEPAVATPALHFKSADLTQVLEIYQTLSGRTVLRPASLPEAGISIRTQTELTRAEAVQALDSILSANGIATRPRGDKFVFVVQTSQTNRLSAIPESPAPDADEDLLRSGLIKFDAADLRQVLDIYEELWGRTVLQSENLHGKFTFRNQTGLTRAEAIWAMNAMLSLADIAMIPEGNKFVFALPGIESPQAPAFDANPVSPTVNAQEVLPAGMIRFQSADISQVLPVYATLLGRKPVPPDRTVPAVKVSIRTQTELTRAEAVFALDALAAINRLKFALVEDDKVTVLPAALARRETNPVQ
jgi:hypothetical protein